jgi:class 3 adenylate cyclase
LDKQGRTLDADAPFPLRRYFLFGVLPGLLLLIGAVISATTQTVRLATIEVLLQLTTTTVAGIAERVDATAPDAWRKLLANEPLLASDLADLAKAFADEQRGSRISFLKIYGPDRRTVFATETDEIGRIEDKQALKDALTNGIPAVLVENDAHGGAFYELYIPYRVGKRVAAVFELYEPIAGFDAMLWNVIRPVLVIPLLLFTIMLGILAWLVFRAQADINLRTSLVVALRQRIERLVSHRAVAAMQTPEGRAETIEVTLLYSDVRGFTGFAEQHSPEEAIGFLNLIIGLQVDLIEKHGGDIDKMVGDAVLARFHGSDRAECAINAAIAIQRAVKSSKLPRGVGIGLYGGPVVAGLIGRGERFDYTVVGDSVNSVARLCGLAKESEIVADSATAAQAKAVVFGPERVVGVKGRTGKLKVRSLQLD